MKVGALIGLTGIKNFYAMAMLSVGTSANAEVHINLGGAIPFSDVVEEIINDETPDYRRYLDLLKDNELETLEQELKEGQKKLN